MRCPMLQVGQVWDEGERGKEKDRCIQAECAWWSFDHERCAISVIAQELAKLSKNLANVANLMPRR